MNIVTLREPDVPDIPADESVQVNADTNMHPNKGEKELASIQFSIRNASDSIRSLLCKPTCVVRIRDMDSQQIAVIEDAFTALLQEKKDIGDPFQGSVDPNELCTALRLIYNIKVIPGDLLGAMVRMSKKINLELTKSNMQERVRESIIRTNGHGPVSQGFFLIVDKKI